MNVRLAAAMIGMVCALAIPGPVVWAEVDLLWEPSEQHVGTGSIVQIGLIARSTTGADQTVAAMDVVLTWDPAILQFERITDNGPYVWWISGFLSDKNLDGLNDSFMDGDAKYTALAVPGDPAIATPDGLLVTTFEFIALVPTELTSVVIEGALGQYSVTKVFGGDYPNQDVTGELSDALVTVSMPASLSVADTVLVPGRSAYVVVQGEIDGDETFGVTLMVEIVSREDNTGTVTFTPAPPVDIFPLDDPWPGDGTFTPFDTDLSGSDTLNGSVDDDGNFEPAPVTFSGRMAAFPVTASLDADGIWDVRISTSVGDSGWEGVATILGQGTIRIVASGDCNADGWIDVFDFSGFQACFTGPIGSEGPPGYSLGADLCCSVFDDDEDGDVDLTDYAWFRDAMSGPG